MIRFLVVALFVWLGVAHGQPSSNRAILNRLDDLEYDQQMRDIQRRAEQQPMPATGQVKSEISLRQEIKTRPDKYRFIDRSGSFDFYIELPINRFNKTDISFTTIGLSDEVLKEGDLRYSQIMSSTFFFCDLKKVSLTAGFLINYSGKVVGRVEDTQIKYDRNTKVWSKIDSLYCR